MRCFDLDEEPTKSGIKPLNEDEDLKNVLVVTGSGLGL